MGTIRETATDIVKVETRRESAYLGTASPGDHLFLDGPDGRLAFRRDLVQRFEQLATEAFLTGDPKAELYREVLADIKDVPLPDLPGQRSFEATYVWIQTLVRTMLEHPKWMGITDGCRDANDVLEAIYEAEEARADG